jgi:hypothetical protein
VAAKKSKTPGKPGRPSTYTDKAGDEIVRRLSDGETLRAICRDEHMPAWQTVYSWIDINPDFSERIARAREVGFDAIAADTLALIDEKPERHDTQFGDRVDPGYVAWQKNRVEQRMKLLAKWSPKLYGDKLTAEHTGPNGAPLIDPRNPPALYLTLAPIPDDIPT